MEELVIGDRKYVSSKRAAKLTGYAKDYVGQLCREGRVPAQLVGRSWYVLESAIQDHRFGDSVKNDSATSRFDEKVIAPRYVTEAPPELPVEKEPPQMQESARGAGTPGDASKTLQEAWDDWFSTMANSGRESREESKFEPEQAIAESVTEETEEIPEDEGVEQVPIRYFNESHAEAPMRRQEAATEALQMQSEREEFVPPQNREKRFRWRFTVQAVSIVVGLSAVGLAVVNTGILDKYIISANTDNYLAGVAAFKK